MGFYYVFKPNQQNPLCFEVSKQHDSFPTGKSKPKTPKKKNKETTTVTDV
jgi:hypothetical protein